MRWLGALDFGEQLVACLFRQVQFRFDAPRFGRLVAEDGVDCWRGDL
jgi:hypothetical protein